MNFKQTSRDQNPFKLVAAEKKLFLQILVKSMIIMTQERMKNISSWRKFVDEIWKLTNRFSSPEVCFKINSINFFHVHDAFRASYVNIPLLYDPWFEFRGSVKPKFHCSFVSRAMSYDSPGELFLKTYARHKCLYEQLWLVHKNYSG